MRTATVRDLAALREEAADCRACPLWRHATQTVFGEGPADAAVMLVGEQPGDQEDLAGRPFVGPAGRLLDGLLAEAGLPREQLYLTNAVKHFKWKEGRGKRRIHDKPSWSETMACNPWLQAELAAVGPRALVLLGATAAQALLGPDFRLTKRLGERIDRPDLAPLVIATFHPSAVLRAPDETRRRELERRLAEDLARAAAAASGRDED
jgi:uracil-DNA glycosylase